MIEPPRRYNAVRHFVDRHLDEGRTDKVAYVDDAGEHTYAALAARTHRVARALHDAGVAEEQRVVMLLLDSVDFPALFFGCMRRGAVPVPINTLLTAEDVAYILEDSRAAALVVSAALWDKVRPAAQGHRHLRAVWIAGGSAEDAPSLDAVLEEAGDAPYETWDTTTDDLAFWLYSSGTTGTPKGIVHCMGSLQRTAEHYAVPVLGIREDDVVFSAAKLFFAYGLGNAMTFPLHVGATAVVMAERPTPASVAARFRAHEPTIYYGVPTLYASMLASGEALPTKRLRRCVSAGEALPPDVLRRWTEATGVPILDGLGSTEMLHIFLSNRHGDVVPGASGTPVDGYRLRLVGDDGDDVPEGEIGELWVSGPSSAALYWNQRMKSVETFIGPWTRTGDKYRRDADGYYHYAGRTDDMLKVSGIWVSPFEVESALLEHEAVLEAAVVGREDADGLVKPEAWVVLVAGNAGTPDLAAELQGFVKGRLSPWKYPRWVHFVDALPKTATGKIRRFRLRAREE